MSRRSQSAYDIRDTPSPDNYGALQRDSSSDNSADESLESLPPESLEGSSAEDLCPSPPVSDEDSLLYQRGPSPLTIYRFVSIIAILNDWVMTNSSGCARHKYSL